MTQRKGRTPTAIDRHIGARLAERRHAVGLTQVQLAECLGITFQQIQKYESGVNRIGAGQLFELGCLLEVPVTYFYFGLSGAGASMPFPPNMNDTSTVLAFAATPEGRDFCLNILSIGDAEARRFLLTIVRLFAMEQTRLH